MGSEELYKCFHDNRIHGGAQDYILTAIYGPIGAILAITRIFMGLQIFVVSCILPRSLPFRRHILRFMLLLCGVAIQAENQPETKKGSNLLISNYLSPLDRLVMDLIHPCAIANEWGFPSFLSWVFGLTDLNVNHSQETFIHNARKHCIESSEPLYCRPEGTSTSGTYGLLQFSLWPFKTSNEVQPVALTAKRPIPIALSTLSSTAFNDVIWTLFSPYTLFTARYLEPVSRDHYVTIEAYSEATRERISQALKVKHTSYSKHDKNDLVKRLASQDNTQNSYPAYVYQRSAEPSDPRLSPELEDMVQDCKAVVPQVPLNVLRADILRTKDVDMTLSNILEGNIEYTPEDEAQAEGPSSIDSSACTSTSASVPHASRTMYSAESFSHKSNLRQLSLAERKQLMFREARLKYIQKHNLSITIEEIERRNS